MTPFEYVAIATSLILSFSLARTLSNLAPIFVSGARYWVHSVWVGLLIINHLIIFFGTGTNYGVESWTFSRICLVLVMPVCTLIVASLVVPGDRTVASYLEHFENIRVPFYLVWGLSIVVSSWSAHTLGFDEPVGLALMGIVAFMLFTGAVLRNRRFDQVLAGTNAAANLTIVSALWNSELFDPMLLDLSR